MKSIIAHFLKQVIDFNEAITPLMHEEGQIMERWVEPEQCPVNSVTGDIAIITEATGARRQIIELYLRAEGLTEVELSPDDESWFPKIEMPSTK